MDEQIRELELLTKQTLAQLTEITFEQMVDFVEARERLVSEIRRGLSSVAQKGQYKNRMDEILQYDEVLLAKMSAFKEEASAALAKTSAAQKQKSSYDTAYTPDSVFFDQRK